MHPKASSPRFDTEYTWGYSHTMKTEELSINDTVEVLKGLWKGTQGAITAIDPESSVVIIRDSQGNAAYAFKSDLKRV